VEKMVRMRMVCWRKVGADGSPIEADLERAELFWLDRICRGPSTAGLAMEPRAPSLRMTGFWLDEVGARRDLRLRQA